MVASVPFGVLGLGLRFGFLFSNGMGSELPRARIRLAAAGPAKQAAAGLEQGGGRRRSVQACHRRLTDSYNHYFSLGTPNVTPQHRQMLIEFPLEGEKKKSLSIPGLQRILKLFLKICRKLNCLGCEEITYAPVVVKSSRHLRIKSNFRKPYRCTSHIHACYKWWLVPVLVMELGAPVRLYE